MRDYYQIFYLFKQFESLVFKDVCKDIMSIEVKTLGV